MLVFVHLEIYSSTLLLTSDLVSLKSIWRVSQNTGRHQRYHLALVLTKYNLSKIIIVLKIGFEMMISQCKYLDRF